MFRSVFAPLRAAGGNSRHAWWAYFGLPYIEAAARGSGFRSDVELRARQLVMHSMEGADHGGSWKKGLDKGGESPPWRT